MRVLTLGTFDLFHAGHVGLLRQCHEVAGLDGLVYVAVNTDEFVEAFKGKRPIIPLLERFAVVDACRYVTMTVVNAGGDTQPELIAAIDPEVIVVGDDWKGRDYLAQLGVTQNWLDNLRIEVRYVPRTGSQSSTAIRAAL